MSNNIKAGDFNIQIKRICYSIGLTVIVPVLITVFVEILNINLSIESIPVHSAIEVANSVAILILGCIFILSVRKRDIINSRYMWIACGFIAMAIPDIVHAILPPSNEFVWSYSLGNIAGAILIAMVWVPVSAKNQIILPLSATIVIVAVCIFGLIYPDLNPVMFEHKSFTCIANIINAVSGILFYISAIYFIKRYINYRVIEDLLLLNFTLFLGSAGILFTWSVLWHFDWWLWHILRLLASIMILVYVLIIYRKISSELVQALYESDLISDLSQDAKWLINKDYNVLKINKTFQKMFALSKNAIVGKKCYDVLSCTACNTDKCPLKLLISNKDNIFTEDEVFVTLQNGKEIYLHVYSTVVVTNNGQIIGISESFLDLTERKKYEEQIKFENDLQRKVNELSFMLQTNPEINKIPEIVASFFCEYLEAETGKFYFVDESNHLLLPGCFVYKTGKTETINELGHGTSIIRQALLEKKRILSNDIPENYIKNYSNIRGIKAKNILVQPFIFSGRVNSVVEILTSNEFRREHIALIKRVLEIVATAVNTAASKTKIQTLLQEAQKHTNELQTQQTRLKETNKALDEKNKQLKNLMFYDPLTGSINRKPVFDLIKKEIEKTKSKEQKLALLFINLIHFKKINSLHGHDIGDLLLKEATEKIKGSIRVGDLMGRVGGNEFIVCLNDISEASEAGIIAKKIIRSFADDIKVKDTFAKLSLNIGISVFPDDANCLEDLVKACNHSMSISKEHRGSGFLFFSEKFHEKIEFENELDKALDNKEFLLYFQPIVDNRGNCRFIEALLRWENKKYGIIDPDKFIPVIEENKSIVEIGYWIIKEAIKQITLINNDKRFKDIAVTINLSPVQLKEHSFMKKLKQILRETNVNPDKICFEITENEDPFNENFGILKTLQEIKKLGINIFLDDFGTGFSSMMNLIELPSDYIKIDKYFLDKSQNDRFYFKVLMSLFYMIQQFDKKIVVEGVNSRAQFTFLKLNKCHYFQGYLFSKPCRNILEVLNETDGFF